MNNITPYTFRTPELKRISSKAGRLYKLPDGRQVPSVTTVLEIINKPALVHWAASQERKLCLDAAVETFAQVENSSFVPDGEGTLHYELAPKFRDLMAERLGNFKAHQQATRKAADIGTELHAAIERWILERLGRSVGPVPQLSEPALLAFMGFEDWAKSVSFQPLAAEIMVFDPYQGYAGTLDWIARIDGTLTVGDWKTGKAVYTEAYLQNAAYVSALRKQCRLGDEPVQGAIVRFPKSLDDVGEQPFEVKIIKPEEQQAHLYAFFKAKDLWMHLHPEVPPVAVRQPKPVPPQSRHYPRFQEQRSAVQARAAYPSGPYQGGPRT